MQLTQKISVFVLLVVMLSGIFRNGWVYLDFYLHQDTIAVELCENKDVPEMQCNGKCHLMKQLKAVEEPTPELPVAPSAKYEMTFLFFSDVNDLLVWSGDSAESKQTINQRDFALLTGFSSPLLDPPELMV